MRKFFKRIGEALTERMPKIVGIVHTSERARRGTIAENPALVRELERVNRIISDYPEGTRVGFELTPAQWEDIRHARTSAIHDVLSQGAVNAQKLYGLQVVPIDSAGIQRRHAFLAKKMLQARMLEREGSVDLSNPQQAAGKRRLEEKLYRASRLHSIALAKNHIGKRLVLSIMGDLHAADLEPHLRKYHEISRTPTEVFFPETEGKASPELEQQLDAHTKKKIAQFQKQARKRG